MARRKGISAGAFMASFSSAGRIAAPMTPEQLQEQADIAARVAALGLPILTADKSREYRDAINARRVAAIARMAPKPCVNCKAQPARHDSIYCSDPCRREFLIFPEYAKRTLNQENN